MTAPRLLLLPQVMETMRHLSDPAELDPYACQLSRMCAAVRASLETHVRAGAATLAFCWPHLWGTHGSMVRWRYAVRLD